MPLGVVHGASTDPSLDMSLDKVWQPWEATSLSQLIDTYTYIPPISSSSSSPSAPSSTSSASNISPPTFAAIPAPHGSISSASSNPSPKKRSVSDLYDADDAAAAISPPLAGPSAEVEKIHKRQRNTEAARRYRQRKVDRLSDVEDALAQMTRERDDLRVELARAQAEADVLRRMVKG